MAPSCPRSLERSRAPPSLIPPRSSAPDTDASPDTPDVSVPAPDSLLSRLEAVDQDADRRKFALYGRQHAHVDHISGTEEDTAIVLQSTMLLQEDGQLAAKLDDVTYLLDGLLESTTTQRGRLAQTRSVLELTQLLNDPQMLQMIELSETDTGDFVDEKVLNAMVYALKQENGEKKSAVKDVATPGASSKKTCLKRKQINVAELHGEEMSTLASSTQQVLDDVYRLQLDELLQDQESFYVEGELQLSVADTLCAALHNLLQVNRSPSSSSTSLTQRSQLSSDAADEIFRLTNARKLQLIRNGGINILAKDLAKQLNSLEGLLPSSDVEEITVECARSLHHVSMVLSVFDQLTFLNLNVQQYISKERRFFGLLLKSVRLLSKLSWDFHASKRWVTESTRMSLTVEVLMSAMRVLINLTHHNSDAANHVHALDGMKLFANSFSLLWTMVSRDVSTKRQSLVRSKWEFDSCLLLLSVLVNSIEFSDKNRDALAVVSLPVTETIRDEADTQANISACDLFTRFFLTKVQSYKNFFDLAEAQGTTGTISIEGANWNPEDVILGGCTSLLLGYLIKDSAANSATILNSLPGNSPRLLIRALGVFAAFHSQIGALTPEVAKSILHVEKVLKSYQMGTDGSAVEAVCKRRNMFQIDTRSTVSSEMNDGKDSTTLVKTPTEFRSNSVSPPSLRSRPLRNVCSNLDDSDEDDESGVQDNAKCLNDRDQLCSHNSKDSGIRTPTRTAPRSPGKKRLRATPPISQTSGRSSMCISRTSPIAVFPDGSLSSPIVAQLLRHTRELVQEFDADFAKLHHHTPSKKNSDGSKRRTTGSDDSSSPCLVFNMDVTCSTSRLATGEQNYNSGDAIDQVNGTRLMSKRRKKSIREPDISLTSSIEHREYSFEFVSTNTHPSTLCKEDNEALLRTPTRSVPSLGVYRQSPSLNLTPTRSTPSTPLRMENSSSLVRMPMKKNQSPMSDSPHRRKAKFAPVPAPTRASSIFDFTD
ncbi:hypothetical protein PHMEG_00014312 [Phytophthora megakarya]|uniref:Uncharacterized protein n=1 Tax=Phytophthora megakarya TaxID=4795 RepID=A0A225W439_9STRA|nr:hypothetical protein PHMEG_00014312 [Phytophthora megakarya]